MNLLLRKNTVYIHFLLLKHEVQLNLVRLRFRARIYAGGSLASTFQISKNISLVPYYYGVLQGWTYCLPVQAPWGILGTKPWRAKIPYVLWKSLTWMKIRSSSLELSTKNVKLFMNRSLILFSSFKKGIKIVSEYFGIHFFHLEILFAARVELGCK